MMMRKIVSFVMLATTVLLAAACKKEAGKSCGTENEAVCDGTGALTCTKGVWVKTECRGPKGCSVSQSFVECDHSLANADDVCDHEGNFACAVDSKALLKCTSGKFVVDETCTGGTTCKVLGNEAGCK